MARPLYFFYHESNDFSEIRNFLNARGDVDDWITVVPHLLVIATQTDAKTMVDAFATYLRKNGHKDTPTFLITPFDEKTSGYLAKAVWEFHRKHQTDGQGLAEYEYNPADEEVPF